MALTEAKAKKYDWILRQMAPNRRISLEMAKTFAPESSDNLVRGWFAEMHKLQPGVVNFGTFGGREDLFAGPLFDVFLEDGGFDQQYASSQKNTAGSYIHNSYNVNGNNGPVAIGDSNNQNISTGEEREGWIKWTWKNVIVGVIVALIAAWLVYKFGWNN